MRKLIIIILFIIATVIYYLSMPLQFGFFLAATTNPFKKWYYNFFINLNKLL